MAGGLILQELVKSHLMFAVREEVNGLRARISELALRNTRLELENTLLRQHALPDTLAELRRNRRNTEPGDTQTPLQN